MACRRLRPSTTSSATFAAALLGEATSRRRPRARRAARLRGLSQHRAARLHRRPRRQLSRPWRRWSAPSGSTTRPAASRATHLPRDGSLAAYGEGFADFLEGFEPRPGSTTSAASPGSIGPGPKPTSPPTRRCCRPAALAALAPDAAARRRARAASGGALGRLAELPIFTIWRRHREHASLDDELAWRGDGGLFTRPGGDRRLAGSWRRAAATFLDACAAGPALRRRGRAVPARPDRGRHRRLAAGAGRGRRLHPPRSAT